MRLRAALLRLVVLALAFLALSTPPQTPARSSFPLPLGTSSSNPDHVPGALLIQVSPEFRHLCSDHRIDVPGLQDIFAKAQVQSVEKNFPHAQPVDGQVNALGQALEDLSLVYSLQVPVNADIPALAKLLSAHPAIEYAEPRYLYDILFTPNDPFLSFQWYLDTIRAKLAWNTTKGDSNVVIGIIDTGTSFAHEDLVNQVALNLADPIDGIDNDGDGYVDNYRGWDFGGTSYWAPQDNDPTFVGNAPGMDHGVLVTGVACAQANNSAGIAGAGYNTQFMPLKAAVDQSISISFGLEAIVYAADHGADILNLSWGSGSYSQFAESVMRYASVNHGVLLVAAAGNRHQDTYVYPASYPHVMAVAATQQTGTVWDNGNGTGTSYNFLVDISAPGSNLMTTAGPASYWGGATGTSMSAPLVCAGAALVRARYPQLNNMQAGEMVRVMATDIYPVNPSYLEDKIGLGQLNLLNAVTAVNPKSVRIDSLMLRDDRNDVIEPLDTMEVYTRLINYLDPLQNLSMKISTPDTHLVEILWDSVQVGAMGTMTAGFNASPLKLYLKKDVDVKTKVFLKFSFRDGGYEDYQYLPITINPLNADLDQNLLKTSINGIGNIGFSDNPDNTLGLGMNYNNSNNYMLDAGLAIAISQSNVVDNLRGITSFRTHRFSLVDQTTRSLPGPLADLEATAHFDDASAGSHKIGLDIQQRCFQYNDAGNQDYILVEYTIKNLNNYPVNDIYAGIASQWSRNFFVVDSANYYPQGNFVGAHLQGITSSLATGVSLVSEQQVNAYITALPVYSASDQDKYYALSHPANLNSYRSGDVIEFISAGPFDLSAGDTTRVVFALLGAQDLPTLAQVSERAHDRYWCELRGQAPAADLGPDLVLCDGDAPPLLDPGFNNGFSYEWSTGDSTPSVLPTTNGLYQVTVTNEYGCSASDEIQVEFRSYADAGIDLPPGPLEEDSPVAFGIQNPGGSTTWTWDFGDGSPPVGGSNPSHTYADPGAYTVSLTLSDGLCSYTTDTTISIQLVVGLSEAQAIDFWAFPSPFADAFQIELANAWIGEVDLELWDLQGRKIWESSMEKMASALKLRVPGADLPSGSYLLRASFGSESRALRVQKQ